MSHTSNNREFSTGGNSEAKQKTTHPIARLDEPRAKKQKAREQWLVIREEADGSMHAATYYAHSERQALLSGMRDYVSEFIDNEDGDGNVINYTSSELALKIRAEEDGEIWSAFKLGEMANGNFIQIQESSWNRRQNRFH